MKFSLLFISYILSFIYISFLIALYFSKSRLDNSENRIYKKLLVINLTGVIIQILAEIFSIIPIDFITWIIMKLLLIYFVIWLVLFLLYVFEITNIKNNWIKLIINIITIMSIVLIFALSYETNFIPSDGIYYTSGMDTKYTYLFSIICTIVISLVTIIKRKTISYKKALPIYILIIWFIASGLIQYFSPQITIIVPAESFICALMYFTIENPDARIAELERQVAESAKAASEAKTAFLSSMSHELRTPLNAIVGLSEDIMAYRDQVPEEVREDSEDIVNASDTLLEIVGNILDINKIEGGKLELVEIDYNPKHEIESLVKIMRTKIKEKPIEFNTDIDENLPKALFGDRLRIKQVINNFLSNAIKYTDEGKIDFSVKWIAPIDSLQIIVADTGHGIKQEDMGKLFEKFERLQVEKVSSVQGTGLGLSITKNLVELMGGQIHVESEYGKGSTFNVTIPQKIGDVSKLEELDTEKQERAKADYTGKKILIVDDNSLNIKVLKKAIKPFNFDLDECYDGKTAVDKIKKNNYDIVLMDIMMPGMGGEEALSVLKKNSEFHTPVIALTADATTGAKEKYLSDGFADYLAKPFTRDIIAQKLEKILK